MYNNTNTDVKVPVEKYHLNLAIMGEKNKGNMHIMTYVVQFGYLFNVCSVASYWMINLFTSTNKREKRRELKLNQNKTKHVNTEKLKPVISNPGVQL